ncbi:MAG: carboxypeptidase-like regulatory domain-containing protein [Segetibacter sp.]
MIRLYISACFTFCSISLLAQTGKITGKALSSKTGEPLIGATVSLDSLHRGVATDLNGTYSFTNIEPGTYSVSCTFVSHLKKIVSGVVVTKNEVTHLDISLDQILKSSAENVVVRTRINRENVGSLLAAQKIAQV